MNVHQQLFDRQKITDTGYKKLSTIRQIGRKGIQDLSEALERFAFIESAAEWVVCYAHAKGVIKNEQ